MNRTEDALLAERPGDSGRHVDTPPPESGSVLDGPGGPPSVRSPDPQPVIGGWVPEIGRVDRSAEARRSAPDPDQMSWSESPVGWADNVQSEGAQEETEPGAVFAGPAGGPTRAHLDEGPPRQDVGDGDGRQEHTTTVRRRAVRAPRLGRQWGRFAELWVPEPLRDARVDPGRRGALILLMIAALAAVVTAVGVWRNQPEPVPVPMAASAATVVGLSGGADAPAGTSAALGRSAAEESAGSAVETAAVTQIVVSVTGLVRKAGLVTVPPGARVADAIDAAGGATADADLTGMNLAAKLADGDSIVLSDSPSGSSAPGGGAAPAAAGRESPDAPESALVNLNTADEAALDSLPGVGPVMAQNILAWRDANGTFTSIEQLQEISGIGPSRFAQISPLVTV
ncbi:ComEA family DNA-binding protein [Nakamurella sp. GG22]